MSRLPRPLLIPINWFGFITMPIAGVVVLGLLLGLDGFSVFDAVIIGGLIIVSGLLWWRYHARESFNVPQDSQSVMTEIRETGKYAMIAFQSEFCLSSTQVGQRLKELETNYPAKFQIYEMSILKDPGRELFQGFGGRVTPTYVLLDPRGNVVMDWPLVLPVERVAYTVSSGRKL